MPEFATRNEKVRGLFQHPPCSAAAASSSSARKTFRVSSGTPAALSRLPNACFKSSTLALARPGIADSMNCFNSSVIRIPRWPLRNNSGSMAVDDFVSVPHTAGLIRPAVYLKRRDEQIAFARGMDRKIFRLSGTQLSWNGIELKLRRRLLITSIC